MSEITKQVDNHQQASEGNNTTTTAKDDKVSKEEVINKYAKTYQLIHLALHLLWLNFHIRIVGQLITNFIYGPWSPTNRKVVIMGDDLALGVGDWVMLGRTPGIQGRLNTVLNKDEASRIIGRGVIWTAMTCAKAGSTSADWVPVSLMTKEQQKSFATKHRVDSAPQAKGASLFDKAFNSRVGNHKDADVVVIVVGSKDRCPMKESVENIQKIASALMHLGKSVVVCTVPLGFAALQVQGVPAMFRERNQLFHQMVRKLHSVDVMEGSFLTVGPGSREENDVVIRRPTAAQQDPNTKKKSVDSILDDGDYNPAHYSNVQPRDSCTRVAIAPIAENLTKEMYHRFGGKTLSGSGYTRAAEVIIEALVPVLRTVDGKKVWRRHQ